MLSITALAAFVHGCGGGASGGLLKGKYFYDQGCAQGVNDAVHLALTFAYGSTCPTTKGEDQLAPEIADRAERSLDEDEREVARGYVGCFVPTFDDLYPSLAVAQAMDCPAGQEQACGLDVPGLTALTWNYEAFVFRYTEECPQYARYRPICPAGLVQERYMDGSSDGRECLSPNREARSSDGHHRYLRGCAQMAYDAGWVVGRVGCLNRTDGWRDAPEDEEG